MNYVFLLDIDPKCKVDAAAIFMFAATLQGIWMLVVRPGEVIDRAGSCGEAVLSRKLLLRLDCRGHVE